MKLGQIYFPQAEAKTSVSSTPILAQPFTGADRIKPSHLGEHRFAAAHFYR